MSDLAFQPLTALAGKVAGGEISAVELLDHYAARVETHNGTLNAVVLTDLARAREAAAMADMARTSGAALGPLHGLPISVKDAYEGEGMVSTGGIPGLRDYVPAQDAAAVARLRAAGAIIIGKTNVPAFSGDWQSYNAIYGQTSNPWDTERTPGGSSGGAAAAIAAGLVAGDIGSDIGGSIRLPAHFCGLFGHKPSFGVVPLRGHIPGAPQAYSEVDLSVGGPLGRSAGDLELVLGVLSGAPGDAVHPHPPLRKSRIDSVKDLRVAVWLEEPDASIDAEVASAVQEAAQVLESAGAKVDWSARPGFTFRECFRDYILILAAIISVDFPPKAREAMAAHAAEVSDDDMSHLALQARGSVLTYAQMMYIEARRRRIKDAWATFFQDFDVVLCPPVPVPAIRHDTDAGPVDRTITVNGETKPYFDLMHWASLATFAHLPASVAPVKRTGSGLPVGVQIIGPYLEDATTMRVAGFLEEILGGFTPPPDFA